VFESELDQIVTRGEVVGGRCHRQGWRPAWWCTWSAGGSARVSTRGALQLVSAAPWSWGGPPR